MTCTRIHAHTLRVIPFVVTSLPISLYLQIQAFSVGYSLILLPIQSPIYFPISAYSMDHDGDTIYFLEKKKKKGTTTKEATHDW